MRDEQMRWDDAGPLFGRNAPQQLQPILHRHQIDPSPGPLGEGQPAKHLGVGEKSGDGKDFARLWATDRAAAEGYLRNDLELTARVAVGLGCV